MALPDKFDARSFHTPGSTSWRVPAGLVVRRTTVSAGRAALAFTALAATLDRRRGMLARLGGDRVVGYADPPIEVTARGTRVELRALNARGRILLPALSRATAGSLRCREVARDVVRGVVPVGSDSAAEEERTRQAGVFAVLRDLVAAMRSPADPLLGLYGAFGYDLILQVERIELAHARDPADRTLVLHVPDVILEADERTGTAVRHRYEFADGPVSTDGLPRATGDAVFSPADPHAAGLPPSGDHVPGEYARVVERAREAFRAGDLFEVVPGREFRRPAAAPSVLYERLALRNPAPYSLVANLGEHEHLVGASPEMFVAVRREDTGPDGELRADVGLVVESAPISGTIARGGDPFEDAAQVRRLLDSAKEESELTMCTDVDRNDKAKVCVPGSVRVTARRAIEFHATLIHTVDRVEGRLRHGADALDAFLAHLWAVTVTGAPKRAAVQYLERMEKSPRRWYGGACGRIGFDGSLETSLTLRTIQIRRGTAVVRTGATLLFESDPEAEEAETELKALALLAVLDEAASPACVPAKPVPEPRRRPRAAKPGHRPRVLMVDHQDSFVHCLADYFRRCGAEVDTFRPPHHLPVLARSRPDLLVLSPGPGRPKDFGIARTLLAAEESGTPVFGVCLGMQALVEYFGGALGVLDPPVHGRSSTVRVTRQGGRLLAGLPDVFEVGRYHSLFADSATIPPELEVFAVAEDGAAMVVEHTRHPFAAVQFHPESIMTIGAGAGLAVVANALEHLAGPKGGDRGGADPVLTAIGE